MAEEPRRIDDESRSVKELLSAAVEASTSADGFVHALFALLEDLAARDPSHPVLAGLVDDIGRRAAEAEAAGWLHDIRNALQVADSQLFMMNEALRSTRSMPQAPAEQAELLVRLLDGLETAREATQAACKITRCMIPSYAGNYRRAEVAEVLQTAVNVCRHALPAGVELILEETIATSVAPARTDLLRVLTNLVRNAVDAVAGQMGGIVVVSAWRTDENVFISVSDNGPGIDPVDLDHLFDLFFTTKKQGSGVGLYVCKQLVQAWGGVIQVESTRGEGARFTFRVPIGEGG